MATVKIDGKTFEHLPGSNSYTRIHDEKYQGKRTEYSKCEECGKLVSRQWQSAHRYEHKNNLIKNQ
jgi:hypothetical protein